MTACGVTRRGSGVQAATAPTQPAAPPLGAARPRPGRDSRPTIVLLPVPGAYREPPSGDSAAWRPSRGHGCSRIRRPAVGDAARGVRGLGERAGARVAQENADHRGMGVEMAAVRAHHQRRAAGPAGDGAARVRRVGGEAARDARASASARRWTGPVEHRDRGAADDVDLAPSGLITTSLGLISAWLGSRRVLRVAGHATGGARALRDRPGRRVAVHDHDRVIRPASRTRGFRPGATATFHNPGSSASPSTAEAWTRRRRTGESGATGPRQTPARAHEQREHGSARRATSLSDQSLHYHQPPVHPCGG